MMGKTHKAAGALGMLLAFGFLESKGYLLADVHPLVQLMVMYPACSWGSTAPDLDQGADAIPEKTPVSMLIHKLIHIGKVRHRSWQTHSPWMFLLICALLWSGWFALVHFGIGSDFDLIILRLILTGFSVGFATHLIADAFTYQGIPLGNKKWLRLVPHTDTFKTNTKYETVVRYLIYVCIIVLIVFRILRVYNIFGI